MILHLSDLHFGTEKKDCMQAIEHIVQQYPFEAIVVTGDITQRARAAQFKDCQQFLNGLQVPYLVIPGNHDIPLYNVWQRFWNPFSLYQRYFGDMQQILETQHFFIIGLNTVAPHYHTRGVISEAQIALIGQVLQQAPAEKKKILLTHQPFYNDPAVQLGRKDQPKQGLLALQHWSQFGLDAVLHGHLHQAAVFDLNQILQLKAEHPVLEIHAGTAISWRLHAGTSNSFNLIDEYLNVEAFHYVPQLKKFVSEGNLPWQD